MKDGKIKDYKKGLKERKKRMEEMKEERLELKKKERERLMIERTERKNGIKKERKKGTHTQVLSLTLTMEQQYALGLKSLPSATITPASNMSLALG